MTNSHNFKTTLLCSHGIINYIYLLLFIQMKDTCIYQNHFLDSKILIAVYSKFNMKTTYKLFSNTAIYLKIASGNICFHFLITIQ